MSHYRYPPRLMDRDQAAAYLSITPDALDALQAKGTLAPKIPIESAPRYLRDDLDAYAEGIPPVRPERADAGAVPLWERPALSTAEVAELIGISTASVARVRNAGQLRAKRVGGRIIIRRVDLDRWLEDLPDF